MNFQAVKLFGYSPESMAVETASMHGLCPEFKDTHAWSIMLT